ncbi:hypothetical protein [Brevibacillus massiliensis]|uniref:hypothetical protein n=1 Tax=Brevibacillus massiliensis TaxID=1118054 RepID=UPI00164EC58F|nr:hypothetical protein [Brevibacillus massiliensis]
MTSPCPNQPFASVFPDGDGIGVYTDAQKTIEQFHRRSPKDAESWQQLLCNTSSPAASY